MEELLIRWNFETLGSLKIPPIHLQYTVGRVVMTPSLNRTSTAPLTLSLRPPDKKTPRHLLRVNHSQTLSTLKESNLSLMSPQITFPISHTSPIISNQLHSKIYHCAINTVILSPFYNRVDWLCSACWKIQLKMLIIVLEKASWFLAGLSWQLDHFGQAVS